MTYFKHYGFGTDLAGTFYGWHCLCCGEILDPVIIANRARSTKLAIRSGDWTLPEAEAERCSWPNPELAEISFFPRNLLFRALRPGRGGFFVRRNSHHRKQRPQERGAAPTRQNDHWAEPPL